MWAVLTIYKTSNLNERNPDSLRMHFPELNEISLGHYLASTMAEYLQREQPMVIYLRTRKQTKKQNKISVSILAYHTLLPSSTNDTKFSSCF